MWQVLYQLSYLLVLIICLFTDGAVAGIPCSLNSVAWKGFSWGTLSSYFMSTRPLLRIFQSCRQVPQKRDFSLEFPGPCGCENSRPGQGALLSSGRLQEAQGHFTELWIATGVAFQHCPSLQRQLDLQTLQQPVTGFRLVSRKEHDFRRGSSVRLETFQENQRYLARAISHQVKMRGTALVLGLIWRQVALTTSTRLLSLVHSQEQLSH